MSNMLDFEYVEEEEPTNFVEPDNLDISYRRKTVVISSADRNLIIYPNPSNYEITLKEPINDVSEMRSENDDCQYYVRCLNALEL